MKTKYLIRLDDACPTMNHQRWVRMESILDKYVIRPMVGVIPHNEDPKQCIDPEDNNFWELVHTWEEKSWSIAMHGYNHVYSSQDGGINPLWKKSEFAGNPLSVQQNKIRKGIAILKEHGINPKYFFAPSHTFDGNTLVSLREESDIRIISDTIARKPYIEGDFIYIPQQSGHPIRLPFGGFVTICYHPNAMNDKQFEQFEEFVQRNREQIMSFNDLDLNQVRRKSLFDKILSEFYFLRRRMI